MDLMKKSSKLLDREIHEALHRSTVQVHEAPRTNAELIDALRAAGIRIRDTGAIRYSSTHRSGAPRSGTLFVTITPSGVIKFRETVQNHAMYTTSKTLERAIDKLLEMGAERVFDVRPRYG